jgi:UDP-glucose 4-epimerase
MAAGIAVRVLITGSRGFIGGSLGRSLAASGHEVLGLGRASQPLDGWPAGYVQADVASADLTGVVDAFRPDAILHAAGPASVSASFLSPQEDLRASLSTWANVLESARRSEAEPVVVIFSSAAVYGQPPLPAGETAPVAPISPYGFHKAACELLAREYAECFGQRVLVCRLFSVLGPRQRRLLVWELYERLRGPDEEVWLDGTGRESRDYLHVDDVAAAVEGLLGSGAAAAGTCSIVNIGRGEETTVSDLADQLRDLLAPEKAVHWHGNARPGDPARWCADVSRLRALVPEWKPHPLAVGLGECVAAWDRGEGA